MKLCYVKSDPQWINNLPRNPKALEFAGGNFIADVDIFYTGGRVAAMAPGDGLLYGFFVAFKNRFHATIPQVANPAG